MHKSIQQLIAIDFGFKRLGIAIANTLSNNADALKTIHVSDTSVIPGELLNIIKEWQPDKIIMGMPYNADGRKPKMEKAIKKFAQLLENETQKPIEFIDESFSSQEAKTRLKQARQNGTRSKRVQKGDLDKVAAAVMLQRWLDLKTTASQSVSNYPND